MNELQKEYYERLAKEQAEREAAEEARLKAFMEEERRKDAERRFKEEINKAEQEEKDRLAAEEAERKAEEEAAEIINRMKAKIHEDRMKEKAQEQQADRKAGAENSGAEAKKEPEKEATKESTSRDASNTAKASQTKKENSSEIPIEMVDEKPSKNENPDQQGVTETDKTESRLKANDTVKEVVKPASDGNKKQGGPKFKKGGKKKNQQTGRPKPQEDAEIVRPRPAPPEDFEDTVQEQKPSQENITQEQQDIPKEAVKAEDTEEKLTDNKKEAEPEVVNLEGTVEPTEEDVTKKDAEENPEDASSEDVMQKMTPEDKAASDEAAKWKEAAEEAQDKYKRLLAEFENARAREAKEAAQKYDLGAKTVLEKLLPVVDNFERAIQTIPEEDKERAFEQGVDKIYKQMMTVLEDIGVQPMNAEGTEFNPDLHNAVMHIEDESLGENVVAEEMQKGYMYKDSVLRYSMVKVAN